MTERHMRSRVNRGRTLCGLDIRRVLWTWTQWSVTCAACRRVFDPPAERERAGA